MYRSVGPTAGYAMEMFPALAFPTSNGIGPDPTDILKARAATDGVGDSFWVPRSDAHQFVAMSSAAREAQTGSHTCNAHESPGFRPTGVKRNNH